MMVIETLDVRPGGATIVQPMPPWITLERVERDGVVHYVMHNVFEWPEDSSKRHLN